MKALYISDGRLAIREMPDPRPGPGEALVRVRLAGICATDLELLAGYKGFSGVPGHEFVGEVVESADSAMRGQRVVADINLACGRCDLCADGDPHHCRSRRVLGIQGADGAHAEMVAVPEKNLHPVPATIEDRAAVFSEPLAAACEVLEQVALTQLGPAAVVGDGRLGLLVGRVLALDGWPVRLLGRNQRKLDLARSWGLHAVHVEEAPDTTLPPGRAALVVDCSGVPQGLALARHLVRPRGTLVIKSTLRDPVGIDVAALVVDEITLVGSRCGPLPRALDLLARNAVPVTDLIDATMPLAAAPEAYRVAAESGVLKVLLEP